MKKIPGGDVEKEKERRVFSLNPTRFYEFIYPYVITDLTTFGDENG